MKRKGKKLGLEGSEKIKKTIDIQGQFDEPVQYDHDYNIKFSTVQ